MASRHDIISITFQANAGKANVALQSLQAESKKSSDRVKELKKQLEDGLRANLPADQITKIRENIKAAEKDVRQWNSAYKDLTKGVRTLDEAIKQFNAGTMSKMSAAFNKAAVNAAKLAQTKMTPGTKEWKEMDALIVEAQSNVLKATTDVNGLVAAIKKGGATSKSTLTQAKSDLEQLLTLEVRGSAEWNTYNKQLKVVQGELNKIAEAERKAAQADQTAIMSKRMKNLKTLSSEALAETKRYWESMIAGAEKGSAEMAKYEANLKKVVIQERQRKGAGAEQVLGNMKGYGIEQVRQATQEMERLRDSVVKGSRDWLHWNKMVNEGTAYLAKFDEEAKIARGDAMSLSDALKLSSTAGGKGFQGTATQLQQAEQALQKASAAAKKGSPDWIKYQEALAKVRVEMNNAGMTSERMSEILSKPTNAKNLNELQAAVKRSKAELDLMAGTIGKNSAAYTQLAEQTKKAEIQLKALQSQSHGTASSFEKAWSRLRTYIGLYVGAAVAMQKIVATMGDLMELSDKMGEVRKTTGFTADEVGRLSTALANMDTRTSLTGLMELSAVAGQLGLKTEQDVRGFTEAANMLMVALPEMGKEGATAMLKVALATGEIEKIRQQMQDGLIEGSDAVSVAMTKIGSTIDSLRANSAAAAPAITDFVKRVGAVGAQSGITIDQVAALGSTVDALGMRVEMSATALSRMIPAIRNNAFEIGKTIGLSQERIEEMYKEGRAMEVIIMLLEKMRGMTAEDIEGALSTGGMADVLKDLNQQGARAGIVFAGLSQNVDELKRQLGVAKTAYEENIAIQNEYNKMNETTAAKWARLKNQLEEMFVGNTSQSRLGTIIDGLRWIVDLLAGKLSPALNAVGVALKAILVSVVATKLGFGAAFKAMWDWVTNLRTNVVRLTESLKAFYAANKANIWMAIAMAIYYVGQKIYDTMTAVSELDQELARMDNEMQAAEKHLNNLVNQFTVAAKKSEQAAKKHQELEERTKALREEVEKLRKSTDGSAEATETLKRKEDELKESEKQLKQATDESNKANDDRLKLIAEINTKYSTYLGYMLSEKTAAEQVASAHQLIVAALKEELKQKGLVRKQEAVDEKYEKDIKEYSEDALDELSALPRQVQQRIRDAWNTVQASITSNIDDNGRQTFGLSKIEGIAHSGKTFGKESDLLNYMKVALEEIVLREAPTQQYQGGTYVKLGKNLVGIQQYLDNIWGSRIDDGFGDWAETVIKKEAEREQVRHDSQVESNAAHQVTIRAAVKDISGNMDAITKTINNNKEFTDEQIRQLAQNVNAIVTDTQKYRNDFGNGDTDVIYGEGKEETLENAVDTLLSNVGEKVRKQVLAVARQATKKSVDAITPNPKNPYGNAPAADSTEYSTWNVEELVFRRKQMDKYKNVLKPGVEVREVLSQDKALMKALDNGLKDDWQSVLGWYNQERLKIQKELKSERISTNEGHWLDEKNGKGRKNKLAESDYALAELDRYYLRRKQAMEKARSEEKITEEMYNRQVELLEQEHLKKRSDLRGTFTGELGKKETEQFRKWWKGLEKQYELDDVSWKTVESEWSKATAAQIGRNNQRMQKDLTDQQAIVMKHMNTIAGIIAQERPYDGITKNLQDNLTKIDVLFADFGVIPNEQIENGSLFEENSKRLAFLLGEAERAYTLTAEELTTDMRKAGFDAWADALDEQAKHRLLAQLQSTYDKIQEAIKKEAAQIKKEVDIWWSDIATGEKQSRKDTFEKALSNLGLWEDGVKRANSLIGAGVASERVADKLAIKQMQIRLAMQATYFAKMREVGELEIRRLQEAGKLQDAEHLRKSLNLALTQEQVKLDEQRVAIANKLEESQNRLYTQMHEYADLLYSSMQSLFEASNTGNAEFYNERAKLQLTGGDGTAKQYIVIDNAGTEDAEAHYEYLTEMEALERQHEIDQQNASAEAWRKVMDDVNAKINEMITDQLNAMLQDAAINDNTAATNANTEALIALTSSIGGGKDGDMPGIDTTFGSGLNLGDIMSGSDNGSGSDKDKKPNPSIEIGPLNRLDYDDYDTPSQGSEGNNPSYLYDWSGNSGSDWASWRIEQNNAYTENAIENAGKRQEAETKADKKMAATAQSAFAKMTQAANLYGIAYQVMSNDNMTAAQKFGMIAVQAAGNAAITALTVNMSETAAQTASDTPSVFSKLWKQLGWGAIPVFALFTGLLGGLMGLAASAITKSKSQIAQATGVSASQGRLATGMLTYAEGNVNEFTDPGSLTPGRHYNVDAADGKSYRAKYMGTNPKTHITNGPEFHLAGEAGREAIIDAHTTRLLQMDDNGIWSAIQTLYNGGSLRHSSRRGRGVRAFAGGNLEELEEMDNGQWTMDNGMDNGMDIAAMTDALNRQTAVQEALLERLSSPIQATFNVYGKGGLVDSYDTGKKTVNRHGVKY
jgi:hypothetical protein